ncbi:hypothetical protein Tco_1284529 [Tanacetum coccineum]
MNALQTTIQRLSSSNYSMYYEFRDAFPRIFEAAERTFKSVLSRNMLNLERQLNKETLHEKDSNSDLSKQDKTSKTTPKLNFKPSKDEIIQNMDSIQQCIVERARHEQELQKKLKRLSERKSQIQECTIQKVKATDANLEEQKMQQIQDKLKKSCMVSFQKLHSYLKLLLNNDLKGTRTECGFKRAFVTLFGQDVETFTGTMFLNVDQLEKQLDKEEFQEIRSMAAFKVLETQFHTFIKSRIYLDDEYVTMTCKYFLEYTQLEIREFCDTLIQHMESVKKSIDKRALHKREHDSRVNERQMQTTEEKVDTSKALDASLVNKESSGTKSRNQDTRSSLGNDADDNNADIKPIYDEVPMAEVQMTAEINVFATEQQHTEQPEFNNEGEKIENIIQIVKLDDALMSILDEMHEDGIQQGVQSRLAKNPDTVVNDSLTSELVRYKELVRMYEQWAKFELTDRERNIDQQMRIIISDRNRKETSLKSELHSLQMKLRSTLNHHKTVREEAIILKKDFKQKEDKFLEEFLDIKRLKEKVEDRLYKQDQSVQTVHMLCKPKSFYDEKNKVAIGYKNPLCLTRARQVQSALYNGNEIVMTNHAPAVVHDSEDTLEIAEITRKRMLEKMKSPKYLTPGHLFWSNDKNDRKKAVTSVPKPLSALTVYPPNTPVTLVPRVLPTKSQVKINLYVLTQLFTEFDKTCKKKITPTGVTEGERGFEQTKRCYLTEVIPFFKTLKEHFTGVQTALFKEVKVMEEIFDQMNNEVDQNVMDKQCAEIVKKILLIENENLIANCLTNQLLYDVEKSRCLDLEAEMSKVQNESKHISKLERENLNLQLKYQHLQESFDNNRSQASKEAPDFNSFFKIKSLEHQIKEKDNVIRDLKVLVSNVNARNCKPYNAKDVTDLLEQNERLRADNNKVKQHYKEMFETIKVMRANTNDKTSSLLTQIEGLKAQLEGNLKVSTRSSPKTKVLAPGMYAIDVEPIPPRLKNNRSAHLDYINHLKESVETVREIVEEARVVKPLDTAFNSACKYTKLSQELVEYVIGICPKKFKEIDNKAAAVIPFIRRKQVTVNSTCIMSINDTQKKVEDHPRTIKSVWTKVNRVDSSISSKHVVINSISESVCKTFNKWLNYAN